MSGPPPGPTGAGDHICVSKARDAVLVQVVGLGNMFLAPTLQSFVESELQSGFNSFVVDLQECKGMDSTFMGTFVGLTALVKKKHGMLCLVNVSEENQRLLKTLGIFHLVSIHPNSCALSVEQSTRLHPTNDPYARTKQIQAAHKLLIEASPKNLEVFGPFIQALEEELPDAPIILPPKKKE